MSIILQDIPSKMKESLSALINPGGANEQTLAAVLDKLTNYERALCMTPKAPSTIEERVSAVVAVAEQIVLQATPTPLSKDRLALLSSDDLTLQSKNLKYALESITKLTEILGVQNIVAHGTGSVKPQNTEVLAAIIAEKARIVLNPYESPGLVEKISGYIPFARRFFRSEIFRLFNGMISVEDVPETIQHMIREDRKMRQMSQHALHNNFIIDRAFRTDTTNYTYYDLYLKSSYMGSDYDGTRMYSNSFDWERFVVNRQTGLLVQDFRGFRGGVRSYYTPLDSEKYTNKELVQYIETTLRSRFRITSNEKSTIKILQSSAVQIDEVLRNNTMKESRIRMLLRAKIDPPMQALLKNGSTMQIDSVVIKDNYVLPLGSPVPRSLDEIEPAI